MDRIALQARLDLIKWYDSEVNHCDMCGAYAYCAYCDKTFAHPCAVAYEKMQADGVQAAIRAEAEIKAQAEAARAMSEGAKPKKAQTVPIRRAKKQAIKAGAHEQTSSLGKKFDYDKVLDKKARRKSLTFAEKYALSSDILKERYAKLQAALTDTKKGTPQIKSRISKQCDTYRREGEIVAKITIIGTSLRVNLPLDPSAEEFNDGRTPHIDMAHKKVYEMVPFQFKVNSKLALKRALDLIERVKNS